MQFVFQRNHLAKDILCVFLNVLKGTLGNVLLFTNGEDTEGQTMAVISFQYVTFRPTLSGSVELC